MIPKGLMEGKKVNDMMKNAMGQVPEQMRTFVEQNQAIISLLNEHSKAIVSIYDALATIAKKEGVKLPKPHTTMKIEG